ncbi:hypothetical protein AWB70_04162 [Caballeronia cordobensis]|uniref:Double-GTPase 2 domain-containing protein n=1 Tax=Caballeronia cordobensis TaxID=1353886 RepID=A0A158I3J6_CABCO|nr:hypothetical protein [Caballeronia cordobensis]SAL51154.1 hypothetical protein AWB70_04162 [Caballeronia cordobensis]
MEDAVNVVTPRGKCRTSGCFAPDERCIEGLTLEECPNFTFGEIEPDDSTEQRPVEARGHGHIEATAVIGRGGAAFSAAEADSCILSMPLRSTVGVVSLVGVPDSGKTTLLASLYEIVRRGLVHGALFAGSETIRGFEERCHYSRLASLRSSPDTPRTAAELRLLHLSVALEDTGKRIELFFADRRGEQFQDLLDRPALNDSFIEVQRGSHVAFLVDGDHLIDGGKREAAIAKVQRLAIALRDKLSDTCAIQLVVTKNDRLEGHTDEAFIRSRIDSLFKRISQTLKSDVRLSVHYIASRMLGEPASGLNGLLEQWLQIYPAAQREAVPVPLGCNAFERLMNVQTGNE